MIYYNFRPAHCNVTLKMLKINNKQIQIYQHEKLVYLDSLIRPAIKIYEFYP
jgi:hypothetical protein